MFALMDGWMWVSTVLVAVAVARGEDKHLTGKTGHDITLDLGDVELRHENLLLWLRYPNDTVIINYDQGEFLTRGSERFEVDPKTGALTIRKLTPEDSGPYSACISNGKWLSWKFHMTVEPDLIPSTAEPPQTEASTPEQPRNRIWTIVIVAVTGSVCIMLLIGALIKLRCGNRRGGRSSLPV